MQRCREAEMQLGQRCRWAEMHMGRYADGAEMQMGQRCRWGRDAERYIGGKRQRDMGRDRWGTERPYHPYAQTDAQAKTQA